MGFSSTNSARTLLLLAPALALPAYGQQTTEIPATSTPIATPTATSTPARLVGDIGLGVNIAPTIAHSRSSNASALPYANFDYGRVFARIDTFGVSLAPVGYGNIELVTRVLEDGYTPSAAALDKRKSSVPVGVGTLQVTPVGAFFINAYHDVDKSGGNLLDLIYAAEFDTGRFAFYPQAGAEYRSSAYVRYFYGVSAAEAGRSGLAVYQPRDAVNPFLALFVEAQLGGNWYLNANFRKTWLDTSVSASPLVGRHVSDSGFVALSYRYK